MLSSPLPTTCFTDTILIPLPVWLSLLVLPILFALSIHHRKTNFNPSTRHLRSVPQRTCLYNLTATLYYLLIVANILMITLEIVRLELLNFGIGLIPFAYVGLILSGVLHWSEGFHGRVRGWQAVNGVVWIGGTVVSAVQVAGLVKEGIDGRKGSKYPVSDQVIDVAVMAGVYVVIGVLELGLGVWRVKRREREGRDEDSALGPVMDRVWGEDVDGK
jgi:hypothetical protein